MKDLKQRMLQTLPGLLLAVMLLTAPNAAGPAQAQAAALSGEIALDLRSRLSSTGAAGSSLYTTSLRLESAIAPSLRARFYGSKRFGVSEVQQAVVEKEWGGAAGRLQVGQVQVPFGIYDERETYASGLIDYPLVRDDFGLHTVDWGVPGALWSGGLPWLQIEAAGFSGLGTGIWGNQNHLRGAAARVQTYAGSAIVGLSRWDGALQDDPSSPVLRPVHMTGLDLRYTKTQMLVRGEYLFGTLASDRTHGWYIDAYYRLPRQQRWSLVVRWERLKPGNDYTESRQITLGVRCVAARDWTLALNWRHNNGPLYDQTWTPPASGGGDFYFQAYHRIGW